jgi:hypothetical protein
MIGLESQLICGKYEPIQPCLKVDNNKFGAYYSAIRPMAWVKTSAPPIEEEDVDYNPSRHSSSTYDCTLEYAPNKEKLIRNYLTKNALLRVVSEVYHHVPLGVFIKSLNNFANCTSITFGTSSKWQSK